jgi:hypothetical protein
MIFFHNRQRFFLSSDFANHLSIDDTISRKLKIHFNP